MRNQNKEYFCATKPNNMIQKQKPTKENFIANHNKEIQKLLKKISIKSQKFAEENKGRWYEDLQSVLADLKNIDSFLK